MKRVMCASLAARNHNDTTTRRPKRFHARAQRAAFQATGHAGKLDRIEALRAPIHASCRRVVVVSSIRPTHCRPHCRPSGAI
jgi:hypothetical protein